MMLFSSSSMVACMIMLIVAVVLVVIVKPRKDPGSSASQAVAARAAKDKTMPETTRTAYTGYTGAMPKVRWPKYSETTVVGSVLKTMQGKPADDFAACKKSCHRNKRCTHFEVAKKSNVCILKTVDLPYECQRFEQRCSDGHKTNVQNLYAHPDRYVATSKYASNQYDNWYSKEHPRCSGLCKLHKAMIGIFTAISIITFFIPFVQTVGIAFLAADAALLGADLAVNAIVIPNLIAKENKKRMDTMAKGEPYDTSIIRGLPYRDNVISCPAQDRSCNKVYSLLEMKAYMDKTKTNNTSKLSASDRKKYYAALLQNTRVMRAYQKLPCGVNCADKTIMFAGDNFATYV